MNRSAAISMALCTITALVISAVGMLVIEGPMALAAGAATILLVFPSAVFIGCALVPNTRVGLGLRPEAP